MYLKIAWRNIWRNRRRTLITTASIFFAVLLSIIMRASITGAFENMVKNVVSFSSGYIQIHKAGYWDERSVDNTFTEDEELFKTLDKEEGITAWSPRLESFALASSGERTRGVMVIGITPEKENSITRLDGKLVKGEFITVNDKGILVAEGLATYLQLGINDTIVLLGQGYHGSMAAGKYPIKGIIRLGSPELNRAMTWMPLINSKDFLGSGERLSSISILLKNDNDMDEIKRRLKLRLKGKDYEVMTWKEMMPDLHQFIQADRSAHIITVYILYLVITFGIYSSRYFSTQS